VLKFRRLAEWFSAALLIPCIAVALSAQSKSIDPALLAKAKTGDVESQWLVGSAYEGTRHYTDAAVWLRKAAASGNVLAQDHLAYLYDQGNGVPQDDAQAAFWLRKAAEEGDSYAQFQLGVLYSGGNGVPQDDERAAFWWRKAAAQGDVDAQNALAQLETKTTAGLEKLLGRKVTRADQPNAPTAAPPVVPPPGFQLMDKQTPQDVIASLLPEAKAGDSEAERRVGIAYEDESAYSQAAFWIRKAAESGDAEAQYKLGHLYSAGHGVPQDNKLAAVWWRRSAEGGYVGGETFVGFMYFTGLDVSQDYAQAAVWWRKAAEQGNAVAQRCLGSLYEDGQGVPQDYAQAAFWYGKAASQGDTEAQEWLTKMNSKLAVVRADQQRQQNHILIAVLCLAFLGAVTYTAIRWRKKRIARVQTRGYGFCCNNCGTPQPVSSRFCSGCGSSIASYSSAQPSRFRLGEAFVKRSRFVVGWFVLLFLFNFIARTEAFGNHPLIERSLEAVAYFFAPIEIIASVVALAILLRLSRK
jgi:TPR repeat protein